MQADIAADIVEGKVVGIMAERILYFLCNQLQTCQHKEYEYDHRDDKITQTEHISKWHGHHIKEYKFFNK